MKLSSHPPPIYRHAFPFSQTDDNQEWYFINIELPFEVFKFDFVFSDKNAVMFDNNNRKVSRLNPPLSSLLA